MVEATAAAAPPAEEQGGSGWYGILRAAVLWYGINKVTSYLWAANTGTEPAVQKPVQEIPVHVAPEVHPAIAELKSGFETFDSNFNPFQKFSVVSSDGQRLPPHRNTFKAKESMNLAVYLSELKEFDFTSSGNELIWDERNVLYDFTDEPEKKLELNVSMTEHLRNNGTLYAHIFMTKSTHSPNPFDANFDPIATVYRQAELITYRPRVKKSKRRNLLQAVEETEEVIDPMDIVDDTTFVAHWKPSFIVNIVCDHTVYARGTAPLPNVAPFMQVDPLSGNYLPIMYINQFWVLEDHLIELNRSVTTLPLEIQYYPLSLLKFGMYQQMEQNFRNQQTMGTSSKKDSDAMKRLFIETNPYLLAVTVMVSILHTVFDMLAFKNDVSFWRKQKSMEGLSLRTVVLNAFFHLVIFLYLLDNDTSWMILFSSGLGVVLDIWKIQKAVKVTWDSSGNISFKGEESYDSSTAEHDKVAVAHVSYVMYPLLVGYAAYQLGFSEHKGWYSWILSSLTSFVYAFGFIMMTPQLYINYKLQSVAHLPWRAMVYKALNTFIDDLFAFVITMPMMHRLACFRDDIIFFVYLYQRWIYRVDKSRVNEFGQGGDEDGQTPMELPPSSDDNSAPAVEGEKEEASAVSDTNDTTSVPRQRRTKFDK